MTICVKAGEVLGLKSEPPLYTAVMLCEPTVSEEVVKSPVAPLSIRVARVVAPSMNVMRVVEPVITGQKQGKSSIRGTTLGPVGDPKSRPKGLSKVMQD